MESQNHSYDSAAAAAYYSREKDYWLERLAGDLPDSRFTVDRDGGLKEPDTQSYRFCVAGELFLRLTKIVSGSDIRLHMVLAAAASVLLHKYTREEDVLLGTAIFKQKNEGAFTNTILTLRNRVSDDLTFKEFLLQARQTISEASANANYPIETLMYQLGLSPTVNTFPLFDVAVLLDNIQDRQYLRRIPNSVTFIFSHTSGALDGIVEYDANKYNELSIGLLAEHFLILLENSLLDVERKIAAISLIADHEREKILREFNATTANYPLEKSLAQFFQEQAALSPHRVAIVDDRAGSFPNRHATFQELDRRSRFLAKALIGIGVDKDAIVGVLLERSSETVLAILAVLQAGGAYLPLDHHAPGSRNQFIITDSGAVCLISTTSIMNGIEEIKEIFSGDKIIDIEAEKLNGTPPPVIPDVSSSAGLAYVIYTSGTTGNPKGVMVEQRNVVNFMCGLRDQVYKLYGESLRLGLVSPFVFDASGQQTYGALLFGHTLVIVPDDIRVDGPKLLAFYNKHCVDVADGTPIYLRMLSAAAAGSRENVKVRHFIMGGDVLAKQVVLDFWALYRNRPPAVMNVYGPTECTINCTSFMLNPGYISRYDRIPIGKPIPNYEIYILDGRDDLAPVGVPGELCVSGEGVVRGYLKREELTAGKFVPDPVRDGFVMYRTGDLARWLPDGNIEFLGRIDNQVKLRGYRIELGEIENRLLGHPMISEAVAAIRQAHGDPYLCAYIVCLEELTVSGIRDFLAKELPDYMIPARFIPVDTMPLTPSGKVDRKALPAPEGLELGSGVSYAPPRNELEKIMVRVWSDVLGNREVGIHDNFFMSGGDSIKTIQVSARMNELGYQFDMKEIFQNPTIAELSPYVRSSTSIVERTDVSGIAPLTPSQMWFFDLYGYQNHFNQSVMLLAPGGFDEHEIRAIFGKIMEHHDALRMTFSREKDDIVQENKNGDSRLQVEIFDFSRRQDPIAAMESSANEIQSSISLEQGPLLRLALFRLADGDRLLIVIHHLVVDGVSWRILFQDLATLHRQYTEDLPLVLPARSASFGQWGEQLHKLSVDADFLEEIEYWRPLEDTEPAPVPRDFATEPGVIADSLTVAFTLSPRDTERLQTRSHEAFYTSMNDLLLAGLALAGAEIFNCPRLLLALEGHGREAVASDLDTGRTVGWFTALFPVILPEVDAGDLESTIVRVKEALRQIPRKGAGYGVLKYLTPSMHKKGLVHKLKPRISFNYLGSIDAELHQLPFNVAPDFTGHPQSPSNHRIYDFDISGVIREERLEMSLTYSPCQYKEETVALFWDRYKSFLEQLVRFCTSVNEPVHTPGDFTYRDIPFEVLRKIQREYVLDDIYPLTPMQEGMLFHAILEAGGSAYFEQTSYRLHGQLDIVLVQQTLRQLSRRHEILRAAFLYEGLPRPVQLILHDRPIEFIYSDLQSRDEKPDNDVEDRIEAFRKADRRRSFDLARDVLVRVAVLRIAERQFEVIWSFHHILMDGWGVGILNADFFEIYSGLAAGRRSPSATPVPYRLFVKWLMTLDSDRSSAYWSRYLDGYDVPALVPRKGGSQTSGGGYELERIEIELAGSRTTKLRELANRLNVTMNTMIQTIWGVVLAKYNGKRDVVFGAVVSGRPPSIPGVDSIVGLFINSIPVRVAYSRDTTFRRLLKTMQASAIEGENHHHYPLVEIQANSGLKNDLIDSLVSFQNYPVASRLRDLLTGADTLPAGNVFSVSRVETFEHNSFDFNIVVAQEENLVIEFKYNAKKYEKSLVEKICRHMCDVVDTVAGDGDILVDDIQVSHDYIAASSEAVSGQDEDFRL